ncbi:MAG TPA: uracil-DNA glycosylase [Candidatus Saccharimonadales bacterium]|nr:uracil-DNA glycosylase [Candidatus Saccharimonadales bacterium]
MASAKQVKLDNIAKRLAKDKVTPELKAGATQLVFGVGNPDSDIVFIGEAPGKNEDKQGEPFVGAAGKFLNEMLEMIDLKREDIYITNIVKYRPPNNRDPYPEEKREFLPYLQSQLEVIQPKVVVTLGRHSMNCFLPDLQISQVHGQPKRVKLRLKANDKDTFEVVILPLFHPAAALYNGDMRQTLIDDFALIPAIIEKIKSS